VKLLTGMPDIKAIFRDAAACLNSVNQLSFHRNP
jgi:hypothetical protein